jgi:hypothetical protein
LKPAAVKKMGKKDKVVGVGVNESGGNPKNDVNSVSNKPFSSIICNSLKATPLLV